MGSGHGFSSCALDPLAGNAELIYSSMERHSPMPKHPSLIERLIEVTGLDWLVMLVGKPAFSDAPVPFPTDMAEITSKFAGLTEDNKIDDAVNYCAQQSCA